MPNPINIYQVFTRLFRNDIKVNKPFGTIEENGCSKFDHFSIKALQAIKGMGITHIWFTGVLQHGTCTNYEAYGIPSNNPKIIKGRAGSPYAITDYYDVCPDLAVNPSQRMAEFEALVSRCHAEHLGVIIDFVPNHVARQYHGAKTPRGITPLGKNDKSNIVFSPLNHFYYLPNEPFRIPEGIDFPYTQQALPYQESPAKATGNDAFSPHPSIHDWYETVKLNYGVDYLNGHIKHFNPIPHTWHSMLHILLFWAQKGVDGLRCDMAEMVPVEFWQWAIPQIKERYSHIVFIAEVYKPDEYRMFLDAGFDFLYDKVGLYDISRELIEGHGSAQNITVLWQRYEGISHRMLRFLENHDEQRIASAQFAGNPWLAVPAMVLAATLNTGPLMLYFGQELGESAKDSEGFSGNDGRTSIFDYWHVALYQQWVNEGKYSIEGLSEEQMVLRDFYIRLNYLRMEFKALHSGSFYDLMWGNKHLNAQKIYAYLRFYGTEILLIVLNFDLYQGYEVELQIPSHAVNHVQLSGKEQWEGIDLLKGAEPIRFTISQEKTQGIKITLGTHDAVVYRLT